jgi:hypothetical protein
MALYNMDWKPPCFQILKDRVHFLLGHFKYIRSFKMSRRKRSSRKSHKVTEFSYGYDANVGSQNVDQVESQIGGGPQEPTMTGTDGQVSPNANASQDILTEMLVIPQSINYDRSIQEEPITTHEEIPVTAENYNGSGEFNTSEQDMVQLQCDELQETMDASAVMIQPTDYDYLRWQWFLQNYNLQASTPRPQLSRRSGAAGCEVRVYDRSTGRRKSVNVGRLSYFVG